MKQQKRRNPSLSSKGSKPSQVVHVGVIFVVDDRVLIESTPANEGEVYGDFFNHSNGHPDFWARLQAEGQVPQDQDYINVPRGRAVVNCLTGHPVLYLDKCISKKPALVREIKRRLHLPGHIEISTDLHYRCEDCLSRSPL
jgi:hypothetical protein